MFLNKSNLVQLLLLFLLVWTEFDLIGAKRGGGRSGGSRGRSGSRGTSGSRGNTNTNTKNKGYGSNSGSSYNRPKSTKTVYSKGKGIGSKLSSNKIKAGLAAAAAGYIAYQGTKGLVKAITHPMMWGGRSYYWGPSYYQSRSGYQMCTYNIEENDRDFGNVYYNDQRQKRLTFGCRTYEYCCGMECCASNPGSGTSGLVIGLIIFFVVLLLFCCCGFFILYKFFRSTLDCIFPSNSDNNDNQSKFDDVPMGPAPVYPSQPMYGQPTAYPSAYPSQPPSYTAY